MPYIFVTDGYPEANEFDDNYVRLDRSTPLIDAPLLQKIRDHYLSRARGTPVVTKNGAVEMVPTAPQG